MIQEQISAVSFDVGGTLIEPFPSVGHVYVTVAEEYGAHHLKPEEINQQFSRAWQSKGDFNYSRSSWAELVAQTFGKTTPLARDESFFNALYERFADPGVWNVYQDVLPILDFLQSMDIKVAVISNWDERLRPLLRRFNLMSYFDQVIVSSEVGFHKPSPVIFEEAVRKLGLPPGAVLHVGDSETEDFGGALSAGLQGLRLRREGNLGPNEIRSLLDVREFLDNSSRPGVEDRSSSADGARS